MYPSEIGVVSCTKGFISISRTFIEKSFIENRQVNVKVKRNYKLSEVRGGNTIAEKMGNNQIASEVSRNRRLKGPKHFL